MYFHQQLFTLKALFYNITLIISTLISVCSNSFSQEGITITDDSYTLKSENYLFWENNTSKKDFSIKEIQKQLKPLKMSQPNLGFTPNDVWFKIKIKPINTNKHRYYLKINNPNIDFITLQKIIDNKIVYSSASGDQIPYYKRPVQKRLLLIPLRLSNKTNTFLIKVNNGSEHFNFNLEVINEKALFSEFYYQQYLLGAFFGVLFFIFAFNLAVGLLIKEKTSLYYCLYIITFSILQANNLGFGKEFLWPNNNYLANHINPITATLAIIFLINFSRHYLNLKTLLPKYHTILMIISTLLIINLIFALIPLSFCYSFSIIFINTITLGLNILVIIISIKAILKKYKPAIIFFFAFSLLFISVFAFILKNFGVLPSNIFTNYGLQFGSIIESVLLTFGIIIRFKSIRDESFDNILELNKIKDEANVKLEEQVIIRTQEIASQKQIIEDKNKEIISSIAYAKRIQDAILPTTSQINQFFNQWKLYYEPKDIVAGDFYWINEKVINRTKWKLFAVADCTGHGVPGAMMSVLCNGALNEAIDNQTEINPSYILEKCSNIITENLSAYENNVNDGMDISLCCYNKKEKILLWSGANNPLWILRNDEIIEFTPTKRPVGISLNQEGFKTETIHLQDKDQILLFTDGILDQFGGEKNKKLKKNGLRQILLEASELSIHEKIEKVQKYFEKWKGTNEQIDDVCLLLIEC